MPTVAANLVSESLVFNFEEVGPTTLFDRESKPVGIIYMDNVMPITQGVSSVAFKPQFVGQAYTVADCRNAVVYKITPISGQVLYIAVTTTGVYITMQTSLIWSNTTITFSSPPEIPCTAVSIQGVFHLYSHKTRTLYVFDEYTHYFNPTTLEGIDLSDIIGIASSGNRLVLYSKNRIFWSSVFSTTDFLPSLSTGAGSTSIVSIKSRIVSIIGNTDGFIIYTEENSIAAKATNDFNFPFIFSEIPGSAGITGQIQAGTQNNIGAQIVWTGQGFQQVSYDQAQYIFPEITEALMRGVISKYSGGAPYTYFAEKLNTRVTFVANRYICISYGEANLSYFTDAHVYDTLLGRWGKLSVRHIHFISYSPVLAGEYQTYDQMEGLYPTYNDFVGLYAEVFKNSTPFGQTVPGETLGIILPNLAIHSCVLEEYSNFIGNYTGLVAEPAKVIIGKLKLTHEIGVNLEEIRVSKLYSGTIAAFVHGYTGKIHRKNFEYTPHPMQPGVFLGNTIGDSVSLEITGEFKLSQLELNLSSAGKVNLPIVDTYLQYLTVMVDSAHVYTDSTSVVDIPDVVFNSSVETSS